MANLLTLENELEVSRLLHGQNAEDACGSECFVCREMKHLMGQAHTVATKSGITTTLTANAPSVNWNGQLWAFQAFCEHCQDGENGTLDETITWGRLHLTKAHGMTWEITKK